MHRLTSACILATLLIAVACGGSVVDSGSIVQNGAGPSVAGSGSTAADGGGTSSSGTNAGGTVAPSLEMQVCSDNAECVLVPQSCCICDAQNVGDYRAINRRYAAEDAARCEGLKCGCGLSVPSGPDIASLYFVPTCQMGRCAVVDLRATDIATCKTAADCVLRSGVACCRGCGDNPIAVNANGEAALEKLVCGADYSGCSACLPAYTELDVDCTATDRSDEDQGLIPPPHCVVVSTQCAGASSCQL